MVKNVKEKLKQMSMIELLVSLALIFTLVWLIDNLPEIIRFIHKHLF